MPRLLVQGVASTTDRRSCFLCQAFRLHRSSEEGNDVPSISGTDVNNDACVAGRFQPVRSIAIACTCAVAHLQWQLHGAFWWSYWDSWCKTMIFASLRVHIGESRHVLFGHRKVEENT